jgi:hypothetical protein
MLPTAGILIQLQKNTHRLLQAMGTTISQLFKL